MYVTRTNTPIQQAQRIIAKVLRNKPSFEGVLEIEQLSEDAISAGGNTRERSPEQDSPRREQGSGQAQNGASGLDLKA